MSRGVGTGVAVGVGVGAGVVSAAIGVRVAKDREDTVFGDLGDEFVADADAAGRRVPAAIEEPASPSGQPDPWRQEAGSEAVDAVITTAMTAAVAAEAAMAAAPRVEILMNR